MTEATRRERLRVETEREIRQAARALLVKSGRDAVTLRAIARKLGITAPALYRYYDSHDALLRQLCDDICADMEGVLYAALAADTSGQVGCQVRAVCRSFRRWALAHPQGFALVFASPRDPLGADQFGAVFLQLAGRLGGLRPALPVPAGGMSVARVREMVQFYGIDAMLLVGGTLYRAGDGLAERAREFVARVREAALPESSPRRAAGRTGE